MVTDNDDYCCPEGLRRAQNRPYPCDEDTDFDYYCPCISEDVEEGTNGWYFLRWVGDEEGPITCEEVAAERKREEEEKKTSTTSSDSEEVSEKDTEESCKEEEEEESEEEYSSDTPRLPIRKRPSALKRLAARR